ncbi:MAG TPA: hypothetical protein VL944_00050 [Candidatus Acidoferrum sp.]|nr:hypothetical protein [Candidatus Acidoferrum sp.]
MRGPATDKRRGAPIEYKLKMPAEGEMIGTVTRIAGATKFVVECQDGKQRLCSIPGRFRRRFWVKENDVVIVKPWVVQSDERGDIVWRYSTLDIVKLRDRKLI